MPPIMLLILMTSVSLHKTPLGASSVLTNQLIERVVLVPVNLCIANLLGRLIHDCILQSWLEPISLYRPILIAIFESSFKLTIVFFLTMVMLTTSVQVRFVMLMEIFTLGSLPRFTVFVISENLC
jgi:hypothetical protein